MGMTPPTSLSRRRFVTASAGGALAALAGCADDAADAPAGETDAEAGAQNGSDPESTSPESTPPETDELDLREANVVGVAFEPTADGYTFDVTLHHDDTGETGYANWWQVERIGGSRLGRRDLLHAHDEQPFTRSETIAVPDDVTCVVVRGHDQTHGYGGVAAIVSLGTGAIRWVEQGADRRSFDATDCP
jgi:hypothetical protein